MADFELATVGDNCIDRFRPTGSWLVGGNALNVAVQLARLGRRVAYFGAVGDDEDGRRVVAALERNGVVTAHVEVRDRPTAYTDIDLDASGDRIIAYEDFGACLGWRPGPAARARLAACRHVHIGWLDDGGALRADLAGDGVSVSQDLAVNRGAAGLTVGFASGGSDRDADLALLAAVLQEGAKVAVVTRGADGSMAGDGTRVVEAGIRPVAVVDTTGAGDTFIAAFLDARVAGRGLEACLAAGRDAAAVTCTHWGGFPQGAAD